MDIKNGLLLNLYNYYRLIVLDISEESTLEEMHASGVTDIQGLEKYLEKLDYSALSNNDQIKDVMYDLLDDCADTSYLCEPFCVGVTKGDEYVMAEISVTGTFCEHKVDLVLTSKSFGYSDVKNIKDLFNVMLEICEKTRELKEKYGFPDNEVVLELKSQNPINLPAKPPAGYAPSAVVYDLHPGHVKEEFQQIIKAKTGVDVDFIVSYDDETYGITVHLTYECEETLAEDDYNKVYDAGYNFEEWYDVAEKLFTDLFGIEVRAYAYESKMDASGWMIEVNVPIKLMKEELPNIGL